MDTSKRKCIVVRLKDSATEDDSARVRATTGVGVLPGWKTFYEGDFDFMIPKPTGLGLIIGKCAFAELASQSCIEVRASAERTNDPGDGPLRDGKLSVVPGGKAKRKAKQR